MDNTIYEVLDSKRVRLTRSAPRVRIVDVDVLKRDIENRLTQIQNFNDQKVGLDLQIQVQQDMIDKDQSLLDEIMSNVELPEEPK